MSKNKAAGTRLVLCAIDASDHSKYAFEWYLDNLWHSNDMILLAHCPEAPALPVLSFRSGLAPPVDEWKKSLDDINAKTKRLEDDYEQLCIQKKLKYKVCLESSKNAGEAICKIADDENVDLIVVGSRGLGCVKRALLGSVSEYIVRNSGIPCMVVSSKRS